MLSAFYPHPRLRNILKHKRDGVCCGDKYCLKKDVQLFSDSHRLAVVSGHYFNKSTYTTNATGSPPGCRYDQEAVSTAENKNRPTAACVFCWWTRRELGILPSLRACMREGARGLPHAARNPHSPRVDAGSIPTNSNHKTKRPTLAGRPFRFDGGPGGN